MNNNLFDILEICLQELENGAQLDAILARYPEHAAELRPILEAAVHARGMAAPAPGDDVVRRNRAKFMQRAAEMREAKAAPRRRVIPAFQRFALSFGLLSLFLLSGTGLVHASSTALPGENLYPVKRTWEDVRLFFTFNEQARDLLENRFDEERLHEINELISEGRDETIQFMGVVNIVNGSTYVSGIPVIVPSNVQVPANGAAVIVTGNTNAQGYVVVVSFDVLPDGVIVPLGQPVEVESETEAQPTPKPNENSGAGTNSNGDAAGSGSGNEAQGTPPNDDSPHVLPSVEVQGTVESVSNGTVIVNGHVLSGLPGNVVIKPGDKVEVQGYYDKNGEFIITEIKVESSSSGSGGGNDSNSGSGSGSDDNSNSNSNDSGGDDHGGGSNSGSGGGGDD